MQLFTKVLPNILLNLQPSSRPSGGGGHEHEPVPPVLVLSRPAGCLSGLHGALLRVLKIHQAEVQSRLVNACTRMHMHTALAKVVFLF